MIKDSVYVFDKISKKGTNLGEIQAGFNMSFVIDGTKDSAKIEVHSFDGNEIEPNTILYHKKTNTWWIVGEDKVERYYNEQGFYYVHNLQIEGARELLNARDLTDCGFNDNNYTVNQFIMRLFALSNFDYEIYYASGTSSGFLNKNVDFIKTFENYTLLSALREFLDAYNMSFKLLFDTTYNIVNDYYTINYAQLKIIPKTGDFSLPSHVIEDFDMVRETKVINKDSFGTCVVSNAENVISSKPKTYPSTGAARVSATEYEIKPGNAVFRLPSKVYKANWLKCIFTHIYTFSQVMINNEFITGHMIDKYKIDPSNDENVIAYVNAIIETVRDYGDTNFYNAFLEKITKQMDSLIADIKATGTMTMYDGCSLNPITKEIIKGQNVPYIPYVYFRSKGVIAGQIPWKDYIFCDKATKETLPNNWQGIAWERGSNLITGFNGFEAITGAENAIGIGQRMTDIMLKYPYTGSSVPDMPILFSFSQGNNSVVIGCSYSEEIDKISFKNTRWIINYVPMGDIKIKVDNTRDKNDIQLYNQNGKLTDSVALSKLINSYSKEISSDKITRYMIYTNINDVPQIGSVVFVDGAYYVINNISLDFTQNESSNGEYFNYYIECEITMCKYISTKSLMVNPNTNIRDYGIPQNFNVKRKQLYRDYYEITYDYYNDGNIETPYLLTQQVFGFPRSSNDTDNFIAVIKLTYDNAIGGDGGDISASDKWYYQLETTNYYLNKMLYVVLDFNDNNIIGYGSQNVFSGFIIDRILDGLTDTINTPISYVDNDGKAKGIDALLCTNEQLTTIYNTYQSAQSGGDEYDGNLYTYSVFIPEDIYNAALSNHSIRINEENYNKDATEVPVFEYVCQVEDSPQVLIGDGILTRYAGYMLYFYSFVKGNNLTQDNVYQQNKVESYNDPSSYEVFHSASIEYSDNMKLKVKLFSYTYYNREDDTWHEESPQTFDYGFDYAIFKHSYDTATHKQTCELLFIAKKVPSSNLTQDKKTLTLKLNYYKLK